MSPEAYLAVGAVLLLVFLQIRSTRQPPYPPGPKGHPFIGNALTIPRQQPWIYYTELAKQYGDITHLTVFGTHLLILNNLATVNDLYGKKGSSFTARPRTPLTDALGLETSVAWIPPGPLWRAQRKLTEQFLGKPNLKAFDDSVFRPLISQCIQAILKDPTQYETHLRFAKVNLILKLTYDLEISDIKDPLSKEPQELLAAVAKMMLPGRYLVHVLHSLRYLPTWLPWSRWREEASTLLALRKTIAERPYRLSKERIDAGVAQPSLMKVLAQDVKEGLLSDPEKQMAFTGSQYPVGVDTTLASMMRFLLGMMYNQEVQQKAQEEIERVVGSNRLATLDDRPNLPYIDAMIKEIYRWKSAGPLSVSRTLGQDEVYNGMLLPKDSVVMMNVWAISNDSDVYSEPDLFKPERYLPSEDGSPAPIDPRSYIFGVGKRSCPGRHLADAWLFTLCTTLLATTKILRPLDGNGKEYVPEAKETGTLIVGMEPFPCRFEHRNTALLDTTTE